MSKNNCIEVRREIINDAFKAAVFLEISQALNLQFILRNRVCANETEQIFCVVGLSQVTLGFMYNLEMRLESITHQHVLQLLLLFSFLSVTLSGYNKGWKIACVAVINYPAI